MRTVAWMLAVEERPFYAGLASGVALITVVLRWVVTSPARESEAYQHGVEDEKSRSAESIATLEVKIAAQEAEMDKLRSALLRLAVASGLTARQRAEIAFVLGYPNLPDPPV